MDKVNLFSYNFILLLFIGCFNNLNPYFSSILHKKNFSMFFVTFLDIRVFFLRHTNLFVAEVSCNNNNNSQDGIRLDERILIHQIFVFLLKNNISMNLGEGGGITSFSHAGL